MVLATRDLHLVNDPADYHRLAVSISDGHGFGSSVVAAGGGATAFRAPLYPGLLGVVYAVLGVHLTAARLVQAVVGTGTVALLYLLAYRVFGRRVALVATAIAAVYPPLVLASTWMLSEVVFIPLELAALLAAFHARRLSGSPTAWRWAAAAGVFGGLACLARSIGLVVVGVSAILVWTGRPRVSLKSLAAPVLVGGLAVVVVAPWTIRNAVTVHRFVPFTTADAFTLGGTYNDLSRTTPPRSAFRPFSVIPEYKALYTDKSLKEADVYDALRTGAVDYMKDHPGYVAVSFERNLRRLYDVGGIEFSRDANRSIDVRRRLSDLTMISFWLIGLAALIGIFTAARRRAPLVFWLTPVFFTLLTAIAVGTTRYRMPIEPFVVLLAALAVVQVADRARGASTDG